MSCPHCFGLLCSGGVAGRDACPIGPAYRPAARYACDRCKAEMHPLNNSRRFGPLVVCMKCADEIHALAQRELRPDVQPEALGDQRPPADLDDGHQRDDAD